MKCSRIQYLNLLFQTQVGDRRNFFGNKPKIYSQEEKIKREENKRKEIRKFTLCIFIKYSNPECDC